MTSGACRRTMSGRRALLIITLLLPLASAQGALSVEPDTSCHDLWQSCRRAWEVYDLLCFFPADDYLRPDNPGPASILECEQLRRIAKRLCEIADERCGDGTDFF